MRIRLALCGLVLIGVTGSFSSEASQEPLPQLTMNKPKAVPDAAERKALLDSLLLGRKPLGTSTYLDVKGEPIFFVHGGPAPSEGSTVRMSGGVTLIMEKTQVSASEVDVDLLSGTINLRGNVSMKVR